MTTYTIYVCPVLCNAGDGPPCRREVTRMHGGYNCPLHGMTYDPRQVELVPREDLEATQALEGRLRDELDRIRAVADELDGALAWYEQKAHVAARSVAAEARAKYREAVAAPV